MKIKIELIVDMLVAVMLAAAYSPHWNLTPDSQLGMYVWGLMAILRLLRIINE